ncbi:MAG: ATP-dependent DNA helicase [Candidatus Levybacteria bacterium]|nr:ATP-dependent DNA helicase [Candidatus Levybacteria bacterium]
MITEEFDKQYKNLNPAQREAVDAIEGPVMVVAGPGTGKTTTLTLRIANILLKTQVNPENILALTFTEAAAHEMRKRLLQIIGQDAYRVEITTFHSFSNNFIRSHQEEFSNIIASENITEIEQLQIVESIIKNLNFKHIKPLGDLSHYVKPALSAINRLKMEKVLPGDLDKGLIAMEKDLLNRDDLKNTKGKYKGEIKSDYKKKFSEIEKNKELVKVYKEYGKKLKELKKYDYNDMLLEVISQLEKHPYLLQYLQEKFQYFLVDEHQDTNASQNKIVELMASFFDSPNLFVVGDEKQAIYRFQGASLENFIYFKRKYPDARLINLSENYRSTQVILDATHSVISNNAVSLEILSESVGLLKKAMHPEEKIKKAEFSSYDGEYYWIVSKVKELLKSTEANDIAILVRNNKDLYPLLPVLEREKIPHVIESDLNVLEDIEVGKMILLLRSVNEPTNNEYIIKAMLMDCFQIHPLDVFKISKARYENKENIWDVLRNKEKLAELELVNTVAIKEFINLYMEEKGFIKLANNNRLDEVFVEVLNKTGLLKSILTNPHAQEVLSKLARLYDEVKELVGRSGSYSLRDFVKYLDLLEDHNVSLKKNTHIIPEGVVRLMTVHKSKGLEFDYVFLPNVFNTHWGNKRNRGAKFVIPWEYLGRKSIDVTGDDNSDERRLFYVALTRARKNAFITFSNSSEDGREQIASQFLTEIPEQYIEDFNVSGFEKIFNSHLEEIFKSKEKNEKVNFSKEFVAEVFRKQGLSVSALNNYLDCPWKYFFTNLLRIPEKIQDSGLYGNAIHEAINRYIIALKKGKASQELLIKNFVESNYLQTITSSELERFIERGKKALGGFYDERLKSLSKDVESELDIKGIRITDDLILNGKIDMIEPLDKNFKVLVSDFKTGGVKSRNEIEGKTLNGDGNYKRQLVFYKLLLDRYKNNFFKMQSGIIEFVEPKDSGEYKREIFDISKEESEELLKEVIRVSKEIINLSFWNERCNDRKCDFCKLREYFAS